MTVTCSLLLDWLASVIHAVAILDKLCRLRREGWLARGAGLYVQRRRDA